MEWLKIHWIQIRQQKPTKIYFKNTWPDEVSFLPKRDYVTFGSLLSQIRLSVTLVRPTQTVEAFGKISSPLCTLAIL